jgi:hypothetical protein
LTKEANPKDDQQKPVSERLKKHKAIIQAFSTLKAIA